MTEPSLNACPFVMTVAVGEVPATFRQTKKVGEDQERAQCEQIRCIQAHTQRHTVTPSETCIFTVKLFSQ